MEDALLAVLFLLTVLYGYRLMGCVDRYLDEQAADEEGTDGSENPESA